MSAETLQFKTELKQILHIIIHSLYSHKYIFLRELISNASDAIDTVRFESLTRHDILDGDADWKIQLIPDAKAGTLTVSDNGVGMAKEDVVQNLGTIARSGTRAFLERLKGADAKNLPELIGQFGVGFYSAFMVADKVTVVSRRAGLPVAEAVRWESTGEGEFTIETVAKERRGTDVTLHLRNEDREYLNPWRLRAIVKKYSDFVAHPIVMDVEKTDEKGEKTTAEETLNSRQAIWLRPRSEVPPEEYAEFYKHIAHDPEEPARTVHYVAEGTVEFKALLYIPKHKPFDLVWGDSRRGLQLYIQRVFIMDDCEALLPAYLRFVRGVVDAADLPLNVSRELLQQSPYLEKIQSNLVNKVLRTLEEMKGKDPDAYVAFFREMGMFLKEGVVQDWSNRQALTDLLLFESTRTEPGKFTDLAKYLEGMPASQKEIYYLLADSREAAQHSPYLESFQAQGQEVLLMLEPIDEFLLQALTEYKGKKLKAVNRGELDGVAVDEATKKRFQPLLDYVKGKLADVKEVRLSARLKESAACLVGEEHEMGPHMELLLRRMGRADEVRPRQRILELNPDHPAVEALQKLHEKNPADPRLEAYCHILYDEAVIAEGAKPRDPAAFARRINAMLVKDAAG